MHLVLYMQQLSESTGSKAAVEEAMHAVSCMVALRGGGGVGLKCTESPQGAYHSCYVEGHSRDSRACEVSLLELWLLAIAEFMHYNELVQLKFDDISFNTEMMVQSSKTDQYRDGASL